jgi:hypothetical protein
MIGERFRRPRRPGPAMLLRRTCACGGTCASCRAVEVQRATVATPPSPTDDRRQLAMSPSIASVLRTPGRPLADVQRREHERLVGHDLRAVRIHDDGAAASAAAAIDAKAFTVGQHVVFGAGMFRPGSPDGRRLLRHELVHAAQQQPRPDAALNLGALRIGEPDAAEERLARRAAGEVGTAAPAPPRRPFGEQR